MKHGKLDFGSEDIRKIIEEGKKLWKVKVEFLLESSETTHLATYNPYFDHVEFHSRYIAKNRLKFPDIIDEEIRFAILHELGHAKEARIYEENSLFPWYREISSPTRLNLKKKLGLRSSFLTSLIISMISRWKESFTKAVISNPK